MHFCSIWKGGGEVTQGLYMPIQLGPFVSRVWSMFGTMSVKLFWIIYDIASFLFSHCMMISDAQTFSPPSLSLSLCLSLCVSLRTCEAGRPLYHRAEGGHKDCQQRETLRISSNEGTAPIFSCLSVCFHISIYLWAASGVLLCLIRSWQFVK